MPVQTTIITTLYSEVFGTSNLSFWLLVVLVVILWLAFIVSAFTEVEVDPFEKDEEAKP